MASADPFDSTLILTADVLVRDTSAGDGYGLADTGFTTIATGIPCLVTSGSTAGRGKEFRAKSKESILYREVLMRPWYLDPAPDGSYVPYWVVNGITYNTQPLTHQHWLLIPSTTKLNANGEATPGDYYDIIDPQPIYDVQSPALLIHHLEVLCQLVEP